MKGFEAGSVTGITLDASYTSEWFTSGQTTSLSIQVVIANTNAVGTLKIQATNDGTNAVDVAFKDQNGDVQTSFTVSSGVAVNQLFVINPATENKYRVVYTRTSGSSANTLAATALQKRK